MRTKFHFFIRIFIEFPIFDMCFPTFREFIILPTKAYCKTNSYNFLIFFINLSMVIAMEIYMQMLEMVERNELTRSVLALLDENISSGL